MKASGSVVLSAASATARVLPDPLKAALYKTPLLSAGLRWFLTRAAPGEPVVIEVASGLAQGTRLRLNLKAEKYYWLGTHEMPVQAALAREVRPGMTAYDLGAHLGFFTLGLARLVGPAGAVHAFEPSPENAKALRENLGLNPTEAKVVRVVEAAVTGVSGCVPLYRELNTSLARIAPPAGGDLLRCDVEALTLDDYVFGRKQPSPQLMKLDIEGAEGAALAGAGRLLREVKPLCLLEVHGQEAAESVWGELRRANYKAMTLARTGEFKAPGEFAHTHILAVAEGG